jgi:tetratricopeptide (TPR) repeat protein
LTASLLQRGYAAANGNDWRQADTLWTEARKVYPNLTDGWIQGVTALRRLGRHEDAAGLMALTQARFTDDPGVTIYSGFDAMERQDWEVAGALWAQVRVERPDFPAAWVNAVTVLTRLDRPDEALAMLRQTGENFPDDAGVRNFTAYYAMERQDFVAAEPMWRAIREFNPQSADGWIQGVAALRRLGRHEEADSLMEQTSALFPGNPDVMLFAAYDATSKRRLPDALRLWKQMLERFPGHVEATLQHNAVLFESQNIAPGSGHLSTSTEIFVDPVTEAARASRDLMLRFSSLGMKCEFGVVQRKHSAEPSGLFRWAGVPMGQLIDSLCGELFEFKDSADAVLSTAHADTEYHLLLPQIGFNMHTHVSKSEDPVRLLTSLKRRLKRLRQKILEDLVAGETIFVRKAETDVIAEADMLALHDAIGLYGNGRLLCVCLDTGKLAGRVLRLRSGLCVGYVGKFWDGADANTIDYQAWHDVCALAARIFDAEALIANSNLPPDHPVHRPSKPA